MTETTFLAHKNADILKMVLMCLNAHCRVTFLRSDIRFVVKVTMVLGWVGVV